MDDELEGIASGSAERHPSAQKRAPRRWRAAQHRAYAEAVTLCEFCRRETSPNAGEEGCACARCLCGSPIRASLLPRPNGIAGERAAFPGEHFLCRRCQEKVQFEIAEWFGDAKPGRRGTSSLRDLVQEFYARELARGAFPRFDPARVNGGDVERGFRGYLKEAAKNFCKSKAEAFRRPFHRAQPIENVAEASHDITGELEFHRDWMCSLVTAALACLRKRRTRKGSDERKRRRQMEFDYLLSHVVNLEPDYAEIALHLGCSKQTARKKVHDLRKAIRDELRKSVADTLDLAGLDKAARDRLIEREISDLIALFKNETLGAFTEIAMTPADEMQAPVSETHAEVTLERLRGRWIRRHRAREFDCLAPLLSESAPDFARAAERLERSVLVCKSRFRKLRKAWRRELRAALDHNPELSNT